MTNITSLFKGNGENSGGNKEFGGTSGGGEGGKPEEDIDAIKARIAEVEKAVVRIDASLPSLATKADVQEASSSTVKWLVGTALAGTAALVTIMTFVLNNAVPKPSTVNQPPTILIIPAAAQLIQPQPAAASR